MAWRNGSYKNELVKSVDGRLFPDQSSIALYRDNYRGTPNWDTANERRLLINECFQRVDSLKKGIREGKLDQFLSSRAEVLVHGVMGYEGELLQLLGFDPKQGETYKRITEGQALLMEARDEIILTDSFREGQRQGDIIGWGINKIIEWLSHREAVPLQPASENAPELVKAIVKTDSSIKVKATRIGDILGLRVFTLNDEIASLMGLGKGIRGVLVSDVFKGSIAEKAEFQMGETPKIIMGDLVMLGGDVIISVDGAPVKSAEEFRQYLGIYHVTGTRIRFGLIRRGQTVELSLIF